MGAGRLQTIVICGAIANCSARVYGALAGRCSIWPVHLSRTKLYWVFTSRSVLLATHFTPVCHSYDIFFVTTKNMISLVQILYQTSCVDLPMRNRYLLKENEISLYLLCFHSEAHTHGLFLEVVARIEDFDNHVQSSYDNLYP